MAAEDNAAETTNANGETASGNATLAVSTGSPMPLGDLRQLVANELIRYPTQKAQPQPPKQGALWFAAIPYLALGLVIVVLFLIGASAEPCRFVVGAGEVALSVLGTLAIIAVFVERAQQIYVGAWRGIDRAVLDERVKRWREWLRQVEFYPQEESLHLQISEALNAAELELATFRQLTRRYVFFIGLSLGVLIAAAGPRLMREVLEPMGDPSSVQLWVFSLADILITGGLIGGGSEGVHKVMVLVTDSLDRTREMVNRQPAQTAGS